MSGGSSSNSSKDVLTLSASAAWPLGYSISVDPYNRSRVMLDEESVTANMSDDEDESDSCDFVVNAAAWKANSCSQGSSNLPPTQPTRVASRDRMQDDTTPHMPRRVSSKPSMPANAADTMPCKPNRVRSNPKLDLTKKKLLLGRSGSKSSLVLHKRDSKPKIPRRGGSKTSMTRISSLLRRQQQQGSVTSNGSSGILSMDNNNNDQQQQNSSGNFVWDHKAHLSSTHPASAAADRAAMVRIKFLRNSNTLAKLSRTNPAAATTLNATTTTTTTRMMSSGNHASISGAMSSLARMKVQSRTNLQQPAASARSNGKW